MSVLILEIIIFGIRWISALEFSGLWPFFLQIWRHGYRVRDQIKLFLTRHIWAFQIASFVKSLNLPKSLKSLESPNSLTSLKYPKSLKSLNIEITEITEIVESSVTIEINYIFHNTEIIHNTEIAVIRHNKLERLGSLKHLVGLRRQDLWDFWFAGLPNHSSLPGQLLQIPIPPYTNPYYAIVCDNVLCGFIFVCIAQFLFLYLAIFILILCSSVLFCTTPRNTEHHHSTLQMTALCLYCSLLYCTGQYFSLHHCIIHLTRLC